MTVLIRSLLLFVALLLPVQAWAVAPTLVGCQQSVWSDIPVTAIETTPAITWLTGDLIVVGGAVEDSSKVLATPLATGLTFSLLEEAGGASNTNVKFWTATAGSGSTAVVTSLADDTNIAAGIIACVYRGTDGVGLDAEILGSTAKTITLDTSGTNSLVIVVLADWNATADGDIVDATPTGTVQVETATANATFFVVTYPDQASAGSTAYGVTNHTGTVKMTGIVLEILGTAAAGPDVTPFYKRKGGK